MYKTNKCLKEKFSRGIAPGIICYLFFLIFMFSGTTGISEDVAIYNPGKKNGAEVYGYQGIARVLQEAAIPAEQIDNLAPETLVKYRILIIPDCKQLSTNEQTNWAEALKYYVEILGGSIAFYHDSAGFNRSPFGKKILFPSVCKGSTQREDISEIKISKEHTITTGYSCNQTFKHLYYDHHLLMPGTDATILCTSSTGQPVILCGKAGAGKVVFNGTVIYAPNDSEVSDVPGIDKDILINTVKWFDADSHFQKGKISEVKKLLEDNLTGKMNIENYHMFIFPTPIRSQINENKLIQIAANGKAAATIILDDTAPDKHLVAASEINRKVSLLSGGKIKLPVKKVGEIKPEDVNENTLIILATPETSSVLNLFSNKELCLTEKDNPGNQGYIIRNAINKHGRYSILLEGADDQGIIWAACSFIQLLTDTKDHEIVSVWAEVWDKPFTKYRGAEFRTLRKSGHFWTFKQNYSLEDRLNSIDELMRMKINWIDATWIEEFKDLEEERKLNEYARERGVVIEYLTTLDMSKRLTNTKKINTLLKNKNINNNCCMSPELNDYCWSNPEITQMRLEKIKSFVAAVRPGAIAVHGIDCHYPETKKLWERRCKRCKEMFPGDSAEGRAKADVYVINAFYKAIKEVSPETKLQWIVIPYCDAPGNKEIQKYYTELSNNLYDDSISITFWEASFRGYKDFVQQAVVIMPWDGQAFLNGAVWMTNFTNANTFKYAPELIKKYDSVMLFQQAEPYQMASIAGIAEYSWNPEIPTDYNYIENKFLPSACRYLFGSAWKEMKNFYLLDLKLRRMIESSDAEYQKKALDDLKKAEKLLLAALEKCENTRVSGKAAIRFNLKLIVKIKELVAKKFADSEKKQG